MTFSLVVHEKTKRVFETRFDGPLEVGRQSRGETEPYATTETTVGTRLIIAKTTHSQVSRKQLFLEPKSDQALRVVNLSSNVSVDAGSFGMIGPGDDREIAPPVALRIGDLSLYITEVHDDSGSLLSLSDATLRPGEIRRPTAGLQSIASICSQSDESDKLIEWMYAAMNVMQSAASSPAFLEQAARAVVDLIELDIAAVLRWDGNVWEMVSVYARDDGVTDHWHPSTTILDKARTEKRTFRNAAEFDTAKSLDGVAALVAAPILDSKGEVIAAIYGDRRHLSSDRSELDITQLEAMLVELLASGVAAGLARLDHERDAMAARIKFEEAFTSDLAREIEAHPDMLASKDADISVLFCDVRGFSRISEKLGPGSTFAWISDVMEELSDCVGNHEGVLVDYIGDELIAMWGTPVDHADHAERACQAALEMIGRLQVLNQRWEEQIGEPTRLGIGINSGSAQVGNTGTKRKFKYGPLGNTVNLASRVEGATKHLKSSVLVTGYTEARLGEQFQRRRLTCARVVNIAEPVDLYELVTASDDRWRDLRDRYETALKAFEAKEFFTSTKHLGNLVAEYPGDGPSQLLLSRAVNAMIDPEGFDPVWSFASK